MLCHFQAKPFVLTVSGSGDTSTFFKKANLELSAERFKAHKFKTNNNRKYFTLALTISNHNHILVVDINAI